MIFADGEVLGTSPWAAYASADDGSDALVVKVVGASGVTIRWVATVRTTEVQW